MTATNRESKNTKPESKEMLLDPREKHPFYCSQLLPEHEGVKAKDRSEEQKAKVEILKQALPLLNKVWVGRKSIIGNWKVIPAQDGSYLAWVEVDDPEFKLSYSQRITESLYLMQHAQQKTDLPFPVYRHSTRNAGKSYYVLLPHFEKYEAKDLVKAANYCERSWKHFSNVDSGHTIKLLAENDFASESFVETFKKASMSHAVKVEKYTEVKKDKALKNEEENKSKWYQELEIPKASLGSVARNKYSQNFSEMKRTKTLLMDCLSCHKINYEFLTDPADNLFVDGDAPSKPEKLSEYRKKVIQRYATQMTTTELLHINKSANTVFLISEFIINILGCFPPASYIQKLSLRMGRDIKSNENYYYSVVFFKNEMQVKLIENADIKKLINNKEFFQEKDGGVRVGFAFNTKLSSQPPSGISNDKMAEWRKEQYNKLLGEHFHDVQIVWHQVLRECRKIEPVDVAQFIMQGIFSSDPLSDLNNKIKSYTDKNPTTNIKPFLDAFAEKKYGKALRCAANDGKLYLVKLLVDNKEKLNLDINERVGAGLSALELAEKNGHNEVVDFLKGHCGMKKEVAL